MKLNDIKVSVDYNSSEIQLAIAKKLNIPISQIKDFDILRRSIDARYSNVRFSMSLDVNIRGEEHMTGSHAFVMPVATKPTLYPPIVVGTGPAGLFAGLILAECGYCPIIIERGKMIGDRARDVALFKSTSSLNTDSNICFGEGGAGTFSDGKLVTRVNDVRCRYVLDTLVAHGASAEILLDARPHIGTDVLSKTIISIRERIIELGGTVCFGEQVTELIEKDNQLVGIKTTKRQIDTNSVILAIGHSARDTYQMLVDSGIAAQAKGFAIGVRIEHPREVIDSAIYGKYADHPRLGAAHYNLKGKFGGNQVYSFCMCPGGEVVNSSTEEDALAINGMSYQARDGANSNAAIVSQVHPENWGNDILGGIEYQRRFERMAFAAGGGDYIAPAQCFGDFVHDRVSSKFAQVTPSILPGTTMADINTILGDNISSSIKLAINYWDRVIKGYSMPTSVLTAIESRTSSPIRLVRDASYQSPSISGLYPCGEGAGYAGGIMSAAIDGIKCATAIIDAQ